MQYALDSGWIFAGVVVTTMLAILGAILVPVLVMDNHATHVSCLRVREQGYEAKTVGVLDPTCYVRVGGVWVPLDRWVQNGGN